MRIQFVIARPDMVSDFCQQPLETLYAATVLRHRGHAVRIADLRVEGPPRLLPERPDAVFLVTQTYDLTQCYSITLRGASAAVDHVRWLWPGVPIVATGVHASLEPAMTARELRCDAALPGEVEAAVPWLVERMASDSSGWRGELARAPRLVDPDSLPVPDLDLVDLDSYYGEVVSPRHRSVFRSRTGLVFANRGCPYQCAYCFVWFGRRVRRRRPDQVLEELRVQLDHGVRDFFFLDYTFTLSRDWVLGLCEGVREARLDISWICQTRCEHVDDDLLRAMRAAGCAAVFYGVESPWIAAMDMLKPTPRHLIDRTIERTTAAGLVPMLFILIGLENQDPEKAAALRAWLGGLDARFDASVLLPRPFTRLWDQLTTGRAQPTSWEGYQEMADRLQCTHFLPPAVRAFQDSIFRLPNYLGNAPKLPARQ